MIVAVVTCITVLAQAERPPARWYKGNTHTHTLNSDGDSTPDDVVKWYRTNGYNFLFITDHEYVTTVTPLNHLFGKSDSFLVINGQEVTDSFDKKPLHINGLGVTKVVTPNRLSGSVETLQKNIDDVRSNGGVPQLNHPNFGWALTAAEIRRLKGIKLMEIYNGHPLVNNLGGGGSPSVEQIWDELLTGGMVIYGIADDDSHYFKRIGDKAAPTPGQAWIYVRAEELTPTAILSALDNGNFYSSTGVELENYTETPEKLSLKINEQRGSKYTVQFIGSSGRVLKETFETNATYGIKGNEGYVRARILESNGKMAWTQPVFIKRPQ
jgi:Predicted metal-dependent phosphoesterases (PHP family)